MNEQRTSSGDRGDDQTPAELRSIEALLGHLGAADRADADAALEERLLAQTRALMIDREAVAEVHGGMEMLGRRERGGGAEGLEQRLYAATRGQLIGARRNAGGRVVVVRRRMARVWMTAAAALAAAGVGLSLYSTRTAPNTGDTELITLAIMDLPKDATSLTGFDDLQSELDRLDRSVHGDWITVDQGLDEESL